VEVLSGFPAFSSNGLSNGDVVSLVLTSSNQCASPASVTSNFISLDIYQIPDVDLGPDQTISAGASVNLVAGTNPVYTYSWTPAVSLNCANCSNVNATPLTTTTYSVLVTDPGAGCVSSDTIVINVESDEALFLPSGFSPNGDTYNDVLYLRANGVDFFQLDIFDRFGNLVFSNSDLLVGWDGKFKNKNANPGSYTYVLTGQFRSGTLIDQKGTLTLVR
jgi:gliding motility-associated-like protein